MKNGTLAALGCIVAIIVIAAITVGGWQLGWWLKSYSVSKNAQIYQQGYERQTALQQEMISNIATVQTITAQIAGSSGAEQQALQAQQAAIVQQVCNDNQTLSSNFSTPAIGQFVAANCTS